ncbi:MAG: hypothetical protein IT285_02485 [Bdellovibrionales bacterium]|nr:hypothetical protein [Bdellovibrionales bacterium]
MMLTYRTPIRIGPALSWLSVALAFLVTPPVHAQTATATAAAAIAEAAGGPNPVATAELADEAAGLAAAARAARLRAATIARIARFNASAAALNRCAQAADAAALGSCAYERARADRDWIPVSAAFRGTLARKPALYEQFRLARRALAAVQLGV